MAYLHCHTKGCDWSQDDFWELKFNIFSSRPFGYNPLSLIIEDVKAYIYPCFIEFDSSYARDIGFKSNKVFSWRYMMYAIKNHGMRFLTQKWWTQKSWERNKKTATCPKCNQSNFDID